MFPSCLAGDRYCVGGFALDSIEPINDHVLSREPSVSTQRKPLYAPEYPPH